MLLKKCIKINNLKIPTLGYFWHIFSSDWLLQLLTGATKADGLKLSLCLQAPTWHKELKKIN